MGRASKAGQDAVASGQRAFALMNSHSASDLEAGGGRGGARTVTAMSGTAEAHFVSSDGGGIHGR